MRKMRLILLGAALWLQAAPASAVSVGILGCGRGFHPDPVLCTDPGGCTIADGAHILTGAPDGPPKCPQGSYLSVGTAKVTYLREVCGVVPGLPPELPLYPAVPSCANHFTYRYEVCTEPAATLTQGAILSTPGWSAYRFCYDPLQLWDCSGTTLPPGGAKVINRGTGLSFGREGVGDGPATVTGEARTTGQQKFEFPPGSGNNEHIFFKIGVGHYTSELSTTSCGSGTGTCGFEGCLTKLK